MGYLAPGNAGLGKTYPPDFLKRVDKKGFDVVKPKSKPRAGYVITGTFPGRAPGALRAWPESGWSYDEEPSVFRSRPEAAKHLRELNVRYSSSSQLRFAVVPLRDWDRLRIQTAISAP